LICWDYRYKTSGGGWGPFKVFSKLDIDQGNHEGRHRALKNGFRGQRGGRNNKPGRKKIGNVASGKQWVDWTKETLSEEAG